MRVSLSLPFFLVYFFRRPFKQLLEGGQPKVPYSDVVRGVDVNVGGFQVSERNADNKNGKRYCFFGRHCRPNDDMTGRRKLQCGELHFAKLYRVFFKRLLH